MYSFVLEWLNYVTYDFMLFNYYLISNIYYMFDLFKAFYTLSTLSLYK